MNISQPFHEGELRIQDLAGERDRGTRTGRIVSDTVPPGGAPFLAEQSMLVVGAIDAYGEVWASILLGQPGFVTAPDDRTIVLQLGQVVRAAEDPLLENIETGARLGLLAIDLPTRRRLRVNGIVRVCSDSIVRIDVQQAYPNCSKFIRMRHLSVAHEKDRAGLGPVRRGEILTDDLRTIIEHADTLFVASAHPESGADVSHRGGAPGFARIRDDRTLRIPDFAGNSMFNTLGNFEAYPHAGIVVPDFDAGRCLQLTGRPEILWNLPDTENETGGTRRSWDLHISKWSLSVLPMRTLPR